MTFADNAEAANIISDLLSKGNITSGIVIVADGDLQLCYNGVPGQAGSSCSPIVTSNVTLSRRDVFDLAVRRADHTHVRFL